MAGVNDDGSRKFILRGGPYHGTVVRHYPERSGIFPDLPFDGGRNVYAYVGLGRGSFRRVLPELHYRGEVPVDTDSGDPGPDVSVVRAAAVVTELFPR